MTRTKFARFYFEHITASTISSQKTIATISNQKTIANSQLYKNNFSVHIMISTFFDDVNSRKF